MEQAGSGPDRGRYGGDERLRVHLSIAQKVAGVGSWENDLVADVLLWSDNVYPIFGWDPSTTPTFERFLAAVHPDDRAAFLAAHTQALDAGETDYSVDHRIVRPDGTVRILDERAHIVRDAAGVAVRLVGVVRDRTEDLETVQRLVEVEEQRRELLHRILESVDHTRSQLAAALHDDPIQRLAVARLSLESAVELGEVTAEEVAAPLADLDAAIVSLRGVLFELWPLSARVAGLDHTLEHLVAATVPALRDRVRCDWSREPPEPVSRALIGIAHEALDNVRRHAAATTVEAESGPGGTRLVVADDGRGFDTVGHEPDADRLGLVLMRERAAVVGGSVTVHSGPGGTRVEAELPH